MFCLSMKDKAATSDLGPGVLRLSALFHIAPPATRSQSHTPLLGNEGYDDLSSAPIAQPPKSHSLGAPRAQSGDAVSKRPGTDDQSQCLPCLLLGPLQVVTSANRTLRHCCMQMSVTRLWSSSGRLFRLLSPPHIAVSSLPPSIVPLVCVPVGDRQMQNPHRDITSNTVPPSHGPAPDYSPDRLHRRHS